MHNLFHAFSFPRTHDWGQHRFEMLYPCLSGTSKLDWYCKNHRNYVRNDNAVSETRWTLAPVSSMHSNQTAVRWQRRSNDAAQSHKSLLPSLPPGSLRHLSLILCIGSNGGRRPFPQAAAHSTKPLPEVSSRKTHCGWTSQLRLQVVAQQSQPGEVPAGVPMRTFVFFLGPLPAPGNTQREKNVS